VPGAVGCRGGGGRRCRRRPRARVHVDEVRVDAQRDLVAEIAVGHPRRRDPAVPGHDQVPEPGPDLGPGGIDSRQCLVIDLAQRPAQGGRRGDLAEQIALVAQHIGPPDRVGAVGQHHRRVCQHRPWSWPGVKSSRYSARDSAPVRPVRSAVSRNATAPACDTTPLPLAVTVNRLDHPVTRSCIRGYGRCHGRPLRGLLEAVEPQQRVRHEGRRRRQRLVQR
jgi:hypothetical protein